MPKSHDYPNFRIPGPSQDESPSFGILSIREKPSTSQHSARRLHHSGHDLLRYGLDLSIRQRALLGLKGDGDGERFLAGRQSLSLIEIENLDALNQTAVDRAYRLGHLVGGNTCIHDEGEVAFVRHQVRGFEFRTSFCRARL